MLLLSMQDAHRRQAAQEAARVNMQQAEQRKWQQQQQKVEEQQNAHRELASESGFFNRGAASNQVCNDCSFCLHRQPECIGMPLS